MELERALDDGSVDSSLRRASPQHGREGRQNKSLNGWLDIRRLRGSFSGVDWEEIDGG